MRSTCDSNHRRINASLTSATGLVQTSSLRSSRINQAFCEQLPHVETVDSMQGHESDVVILDLVIGSSDIPR